MKNSITKLTEKEIDFIDIQGGSAKATSYISAFLAGLCIGFLYPKIDKADYYKKGIIENFIETVKTSSLSIITLFGIAIIIRKTELMILKYKYRHFLN